MQGSLAAVRGLFSSSQKNSRRGRGNESRAEPLARLGIHCPEPLTLPLSLGVPSSFLVVESVPRLVAAESRHNVGF